MINKTDFLTKLDARDGRKVKELNQLIFNWQEDEGGGTSNGIDEELIKPLEKACKYWLYLVDNEAEGFRDQAMNKTFHLLLKYAITQDIPINYFGILCPSYKKGIGAVGFADKPGNTTHRAFNNLKQMVEVTQGLGIKCDVRMYFANISLESTDKLTVQDMTDLISIIKQDEQIAQKAGIEFMILTEAFPSLRQDVGGEGKLVDLSKIPVGAKYLERAMWRDRQFYPSMFGWSIKEAENRTRVHAQSYCEQGQVIRSRLLNPVMIYSAYDYEKGGLYNGIDGSWTPSIIYPKKDDTNPPHTTLR